MNEDVATGTGGEPMDGRRLLAAATAATEWLAGDREAINALNVFPVPDGDTGSNMVLTMRAAIAAGEPVAAVNAAAGPVAAELAHGALLGARGNSGVILSQIIRGFADAIAERCVIDGRDLARALAAGRDRAYQAVLEPVEGTMLTVIRVAAEQAGTAAARTPALPVVLAAAVRGAEEALATTPDLLAILRQAGVVDAGGQGLVRILEGIERYTRGEPIPVAPAAVAVGAAGAEMAFLDRVAALHGETAFGYCTNFIVFGEGIDLERARGDLATMGQSAVVVGDERALKVHLHTLNPGRVLEYALALGELDQIKIDNMEAQTRALTSQRAAHPAPPGAGFVPAAWSPADGVAGTVTVVAVATGDGLAEVLREFGAGGIVPGGPTMNPSIAELLAAVEAAPTPEVILLPNNANVLLTADQVPTLAGKRVAVVPSRSVPQGLAALAAFVDGDELATNARKMTGALDRVQTIEVARAERDAWTGDTAVAAGDVIGLLDDRLVAAGDDLVVVALAAIEGAAPAAELVTIFAGDGATADEAGRLRDQLAAAHPELTIEVLAGGQPHYPFVIAVE